MCAYSALWAQKKALGSLELDCELSVWVLGPELRSSAGAAKALTCRDISSPYFMFNNVRLAHKI